MSIERADAAGAAATVPLSGTVGLIGLGAMGQPIAANFVAAGQHLLVRDADPAVQEQFVASHPGAAAATDFAGCDVVVLILPTSDIVDRVVSSAAVWPGDLSGRRDKGTNAATPSAKRRR